MLTVLGNLNAPVKDKLNAAMDGWGVDAEAIKALTKGASDTQKQAVLNDAALGSRLSSELSRADMLTVLGNLNAPVKDKLNAVMDGWGVDAEAIKALTKGASDAQKQAVLNDAALGSRLSSELSRADMLTVLGNLNAPVKDKLNAAMDGWGVDAEAIKALTKGASDAQKQAVLNDAALGSRLSSELSRADMLTVLGNLNAPVKDKLNAVMDGWGTDEQAIRELMVNATGAERNKALSDTVLVSRLASELSLSEMMSILADAGVPFKTRFELALNPWSAELSQLQPLVENATDAERQTVWSDAALMSQANTALGEQDYLTLVTTLGMFQPGTTAEDGKSHTSAGDADTYIQTHIATYVAEAVKNGRQIAGLVAVVDNADWDRAGIAHYGASTWNGGKKTQINGFVDSQGRVWIHKDRGNAGTMIHEAVHKYSDHGLIGISQPLNEGVTEYFTRKVCAAVTPPITGRLNYQNNYDCVVVLVSLVTESTIASAYFDGKTDELKNAFIKAKSETDWDDFIGETKQNRWANATRLCTP
jgi:negative regulator of sigma E activity